MREARPELHPRLPAPKIEGTTEEALARMREREPGRSEQMETPTGVANYWNRRYGERRLREMQEQMGGTVQ
jgi:hypothetical protein